MVQWALAYLAGAWVVLEASGYVGDQFGWPDIVGQVLTVLAFSGFFVVLVVAWYHGEKGRQWVSGPELLIIALLLLISGGVLRMLGGGNDLGVMEGTEGAGQENATPVTTEEDGRSSIAVMPFDDFSPDPANAYFAHGMQEEITSRLAMIQALEVRGRTSVERYRENRPPVTDIARELGVTFLLEGSARVAGDQVRITAQLIDARTDVHLWSETYDSEFTLDNLFEVQTDVARQVAQAVGSVVSPEDQARITFRPTEDLDAYNLFLLGWHHWNQFTEESVRLSIQDFSQAIELDSTFALAYGGLADAYMVLGLGFGLGASAPGDFMPRAKDAALRAIELDPGLAYGYSVLAMITFVYDYDYAEAQRLLDRALELDPDLEISHARQALLFAVLGSHEDAIRANRRAAEIDPLRPITATDYGFILVGAGRLDEAFEAAEYVRILDPNFDEGALLMGTVLNHHGRFREAISVLGEVEGAYAQNPRIRGNLAYAYARSGDEGRAREILGELLSLSEERYVSPRWFGIIHMGLGEDEEALDWFERAVEVRADWTNWYRLFPGIDRLQSSERFHEILRRMNLSPEGGALR
jgi:TolB-like protein/Tfp pilus assembly protein PilF